MKIWHNLYSKNITLENIFQSWQQFVNGKRNKQDVQVFNRHLEDNLFRLYGELKTKTYKHSGYKSFFVSDPKVRHIHKACVKDRVVHHLVSKILEKIFDSTFYTHSYSCRKNKGTHRGVKAFIKLARKASKNNTSKLFVLKCDIKKFFANVDHEVLIQLLRERIKDADFLWLLEEIIESFKAENMNKGMPIGNLTSQLFANIYMDPLDQYVKHKLKAKYYIRYADDFVVMSENKEYLESLAPKIEKYLLEKLKLSFHPKKIHIQDYYLGIDFLGYVVFPKFVLPRTKTKRRMFRKVREKLLLVDNGKSIRDSLHQTTQSYLGYLIHANAFNLSRELRNAVGN